jgi:hypothetical protein
VVQNVHYTIYCFSSRSKLSGGFSVAHRTVPTGTRCSQYQRARLLQRAGVAWAARRRPAAGECDASAAISVRILLVAGSFYCRWMEWCRPPPRARSLTGALLSSGRQAPAVRPGILPRQLERSRAPVLLRRHVELPRRLHLEHQRSEDLAQLQGQSRERARDRTQRRRIRGGSTVMTTHC